EKASGTKLPVVEDGVPVEGPALHIGNTSFAAGCNLSLDDLTYDGYVVSPQGTNLVISGRTDQGTIYGIYGFLHDYIGARWYMPYELWQVVPKTDPLAVEIKQSINNPDFPYRVWQAGWYSPLITEWCTRNRITTYMFEPLDSPYRTFNHNLYTIFTKSKYGESHPEYFSEIEGKRYIPDDDSGRGQPCFTDPGVIRTTVEAIRDFFMKNPTASQYSVSINDNNDMCTCADCRALDEPYVTFRGVKMHSDSYFHFVSEVAKEILKSHPGKTIGCYAYWGVELPPRKIKRLPSNVVVQLTQDSSQHFDPAYKDKDQELFLKWSKVADRLIQYDYYNLGWLTPRYYPHTIADNLKFIHANKSVGTYAEIYPYWATQDPQLILASELAWDIDRDPDAILDEYFTTLYGDAAPDMREFYDVLERIWNKDRPGQWFQGLIVFKGETTVFDMKAMAEARKILNRAFSKSDGLVRDRVAYVRRYFDFSYMIESAYENAMRLEKMPLASSDDFNRLADQIVRTARLVRQTENLYEGTIIPDPAYILYYKPDMPYFKFGSYYKLDQWEETIALSIRTQMERMKKDAALHPDSVELMKMIDHIEERLSKLQTCVKMTPKQL
ncbi:MAG: DUF4838 domain-containing protein, partial [Armatimonadota bacterium]